MSSNSSAKATGVANYDFSGLVAVVTGGSQGIGAAIARQLTGHGATVAVWDLAPQDTDNQWRVDVTDADSVFEACQQTLSELGRIDILVNSAGYAGPTQPLETYDPAVWERIVHVNLVGTFNTCRAIVPAMQRKGTGRIVNVASLAGKEGTPNASAYSAAKAGVMALTKSLGKELADTDILVNAVAPAAIRTTLLEQMSPAHVQTMIDKSPMRRLGESEEVAELVTWLCSGSCTFSTGAVFDLSGGRATY
ncbi:SDR family NAD(P)-dependent oxidoreductase [Cupriavidus sp. IDO]|uniref:SDR family NAD(P)-dependent oxidoreductase n=1 Tax=Cupriavidus sp. IDO TaxID=1539142 RepID=UPI00068F75B9|nr:SDR family NAD(P)-dependent oxidoreductase [Cupriavidus sp. IDO]KWR88191.1 3-oxoacyl-ACP reductase [Cupriavidus sp. IDO]